jgi:hypothetical protein
MVGSADERGLRPESKIRTRMHRFMSVLPRLLGGLPSQNRDGIFTDGGQPEPMTMITERRESTEKGKKRKGKQQRETDKQEIDPKREKGKKKMF